MKLKESATTSFYLEDGTRPALTPEAELAITLEIREHLTKCLQLHCGIEEVLVTGMTIVVDKEGKIILVECETNTKQLRFTTQHPREYDIVLDL